MVWGMLMSSLLFGGEDVIAEEIDAIGRGIKKIQQTNLLFIMFDDLRPELSVYGKYHMITPNFERLAKRSVVFEHAYAQISVCNPSRDSLLTGLRPDTVGTYGFQSSYSSYHPHMIFPTKLKRAGYRTIGLGKVISPALPLTITSVHKLHTRSIFRDVVCCDCDAVLPPHTYLFILTFSRWPTVITEFCLSIAPLLS